MAQYYFDTLFPRIPEVARREILSQLEYRGLPTKGSGSTGTTKQPDTGVRRPPSVKAALSVNLGQRAPHRAGQREEGRGIDPTLKGETARKEKERSGSRDLDAGGGIQADYTRARSPPRGEYRSSDRDYRDRGDRRDYDRNDRDRSRDRHYDRRDRDYERRDRDYDRRDRDYDRRDRDRGRDRDYERSRDRDHGRDRDYRR